MKSSQYSNFPSLIALIIGILNQVTLLDGHAKGINSIIKGFCMNEYKKEVIRSSKTMNSAIGEFTCDCFVERFSKGDPFDLARERCKTEASKTFELQFQSK